MAMLEKPVNRRSVLKGGLVASTLAVLSGCGKKQNVSTDGTGGTLVIYSGNPVAIDPYNAQESNGTVVTYNLFDSLTRYDFKKKELQPLAASSWEVSADNKTFTFHIKEGAKFHNGETVDAMSFKRGWTRVVDPKTQGSPSVVSYHLAMVKGYDELLSGDTKEFAGLSCPDPQTFVVELTEPFADFPTVCAHVALAPVPQAALDNPADFLIAPIGNGPFQMDGKWVDSQYITIKRFDDYYGEKAKLDMVHFNIQKDPETAYREFEAGNITVTSVPTTQFKIVKEKYGTSEDGYTITPKHQLANGASASVNHIQFNLKNPACQDVDVRRALSLAIDRQAIVDNVTQGANKPADGIIPPVIEGYQEGAWKYCKYDPEQANQLLDKKYPRNAEGKRDLTVELEYNLDGSVKDVMAAVANDWAKLGIQTQTTTKEWAAVLQDYNDHNFMIGRSGWSADYPILDNFLYPLFQSESTDNGSAFSDAEIDKKLEQARATSDKAQRIALYQEINKLIGEQVPMIPLTFGIIGRVGADNVKTLYTTPLGNQEFVSAELTN